MTKFVLIAGLSLLAASAAPAFALAQAAGTQAAGTQAAGTQAAGTQAAGTQSVPAQTGGAAASLPNTFDTPAAARQGQGQGQGLAQLPAASAAEPASSPAVVAAAETALKATIAALQNGAPNYADMSPDLASKVREKQVQMTGLVHGFGVLQSVAHVATENGAELFLVTFDRQATQWIIAQDAEHKIRALLFRPAPTASSSPASRSPAPMSPTPTPPAA